MLRSSFLFMVLALAAIGTRADVAGVPDLPEAPTPVLTGDLGAFFEFHTDARNRDFGSGKPRGETARKLGVECGVFTGTAPVAQWIARPPPKGQVAGSIPARGTNSR